MKARNNNRVKKDAYETKRERERGGFSSLAFHGRKCIRGRETGLGGAASYPLQDTAKRATGAFARSLISVHVSRATSGGGGYASTRPITVSCSAAAGK